MFINKNKCNIKHDFCASKFLGNQNSLGCTSEGMHSIIPLLALINTRKGGVSYVADFKLQNNSLHGNDIGYFVGLKKPKTLAEQLMKEYYPTIIKNFVKSGIPNEGKF